MTRWYTRTRATSGQAATVADRHYVMEHGRVVDMIPNGALGASMGKLHDYLGV